MAEDLFMRHEAAPGLAVSAAPRRYPPSGREAL